MADYIYDQAWADEKRRLDALAAVYDEGSIQSLRRLGVESGATWLEVGGGSGTIASWLAQQLGPTGRLVATDLDVRFLQSVADRGVHVLQHDVVADPLDQEAFDGAHARAVLEHLPDSDRALRNILSALRPGGWFLAEDVVFPVPRSYPHTPLLEKTVDAFAQGFRAAGADPYYGLQLPDALQRAGFSDVACEARTPVAHSGTESMSFFVLSLEHLRDKFAAAGLLSKEESEEALALFRRQGITLLQPTMVAAWGRKPVETR